MTRLWRRALVVSAVASLVAVVLAPALLGGADPARAQTSSDPIWSATMTVGDVSFGLSQFGYGNAATLGTAVGSLTPSTFSHGGVSFTVDLIAYGSVAGQLQTIFSWTGSPTFASAYAICIDDVLAFTGTGTQMFGTSGTSS